MTISSDGWRFGHRKRWPVGTRGYPIALSLVVALVATACSVGGGDSEPNRSTTTTLAPTTTTTLAPTTTRAADTTAATTAVLPAETDPVVYVVMGDSVMFGSSPSVMSTYKRMLEADLEVEVELRDHTEPGQLAEDFLEKLRSNEQLRTDLTEADVVLFQIPNHEWAEPSMTVMGEDGRDPADCGGDDGLRCLRAVAAHHNAITDLAFQELTALADPSKVLIRVVDRYQFTPGQDDAAAIETLAPILGDTQEYVQVVAAKYGIPVARAFDEFLSPDGEGLPEQKGLVSSDGIHLTSEGAELIAALVRDLGYETAGEESAETVVVTGLLARPAEYIRGAESGEPLPGGRLPHTRGTTIRGPIMAFSDGRANGFTEQLMDIDFFQDGDRTTGMVHMPKVTITNEGGTWVGTAEGTTTWTTTRPGHMHHLHYVLIGTGDYEGLELRYHVQGIEYPWTVFGTIGPVRS